MSDDMPKPFHVGDPLPADPTPAPRSESHLTPGFVCVPGRPVALSMAMLADAGKARGALAFLAGAVDEFAAHLTLGRGNLVAFAHPGDPDEMATATAHYYALRFALGDARRALR